MGNKKINISQNLSSWLKCLLWLWFSWISLVHEKFVNNPEIETHFKAEIFKKDKLNCYKR